MMTALSYMGAHWFLILACIGLTVGLAAFGWFTKNWKALAAAVCVVFAGLFYQSADLGGYKRALDEQKAEEIQTLKNRLLTISIVSAADSARAAADVKLNTDLETLARDTPPNAAVCLDAATAHRVWAVRQLAVTGAAPLPARRVPNVLQSLRRPR